MKDVVVGIFVGGASRRMGGQPKGLLPAPENDGRSVVERTLYLSRAIGNDVVLVGDQPAYAHLGCPALADAPGGAGPLGGLVALLSYANERGNVAIGLACDMPYLTPSLLARLASAEAGPIVAPRDAGFFSTLFARYDAARVLPIARRRLLEPDKSLQALFRDAGACELAVSDEERAALADWDAPSDVKRGGDDDHGPAGVPE
jgi:molybdopterin-guanine dinucleotide biosynthesis protein A